MGCVVVLRSPIRSASRYGKVMFAELKHFLIYQADRLEYKELGVVTDTECSNLRIMVHHGASAAEGLSLHSAQPGGRCLTRT